MADIFNASTIEAVYLVELDVQPPTAGATTGRTDFGDREFAIEEENDSIENTASLYRWASRPYRSRPDDTPPDTEWEHRLLRPLDLRRSLPLVPGGAGSGIVSATLGKVGLTNIDGALDALVRSFSVDGRDVTIRRVAPGAAYATATPMFTGTAEGWAFANREKVELTVRGQAHRLNGPVQQNLYGGTGGGDGGSDIANLPKPLCFGYVRNMTPVPVDRDIQLWQVHDGPVNDIPQVYDGAVPLTQATDYATLEDLNDAGNDPAGGTYSTCLALGFFRLGARPEYQVTANVEGDTADDDADDTFWTTTADIARRLLRRAGIPPEDIDDAGVDALATLQPAPVGYHVPAAPVNAAATVAELLAGIGAFLIETPAGQFTMRRLDAPEAGGDRIGEDAQLDLSIAALPEELRPLIWRIGVSWGLNWTVQQIQIDAVAADDDWLDFIRQPARVAIAFDTGIKTIWRLARDHVADIDPVLGFFRDEEDALAEATRLLALWGVPRQALSVTVAATGLDRDIGDSVALVSGRYGMEAGAACRIYGSAFDAGADTLTLNLLR